MKDAGAVVGSVVLGDQGGGVVAGGHEKGEEREVEDSGRHGGGDIEGRVFRQELAVDELHDAVARAVPQRCRPSWRPGGFPDSRRGRKNYVG